MLSQMCHHMNADLRRLKTQLKLKKQDASRHLKRNNKLKSVIADLEKKTKPKLQLLDIVRKGKSWQSGTASKAPLTRSSLIAMAIRRNMSYIAQADFGLAAWNTLDTSCFLVVSVM